MINGNQTFSVDDGGVAEVAVAQGHSADGFALVTEALNNLTVPALAQANEPLRIYLSCFCVLRVYDAERAVDLLADAHRLMRSRAATIADEASRQAFWQSGAINRALAHEFQDYGYSLMPLFPPQREMIRSR